MSSLPAENPQGDADTRANVVPLGHAGSNRLRIAEPQGFWLKQLESLSKAAALFVFVAYVLGYIIVSVHDYSYGFTELSPFKPRILSAGILFLVFALFPIIYAHIVFRSDKPQRFPLTLAWMLSRTWVYIFGCFAFASILKPIFTGGPDVQLPLWESCVLGVIVLLALSATGAAVIHYDKAPWLVSFLFAAVLPLFLWGIFVASKSYGTQAATLWLCGIGIPFFMTRQNVKRGQLSLIWDIAYPAILAISLFPHYLYPRIKYAWGGGEPIPVVVYFSPESRLFSGQQVPGRLLEESDSGFYVVLKDQTGGLYIPRNAVAALSFSAPPTGSN